MNRTFYTGKTDIIILAYGKRLVNIVCLIVQNHISAIFYGSKKKIIFLVFLRYPVSRAILSILNIVWGLKWDCDMRLDI
jgi:hypothetical protein